MKTILLLIFFFSITISAKAIDTLTIRQVFNFDVGDTFQFSINSHHEWHNPQILYDQTYIYEFTVLGKNMATTNDSVTYITHSPSNPADKNDTIIYTNLDSNIFYYDTIRDNYPSGINLTWNFSSFIYADSLPANQFYRIQTDHGNHHLYAAGLGCYKHGNGYGNPIDGGASIDTQLCYFSKGAKKHGTRCYASVSIHDLLTKPITLSPNPAFSKINFELSGEKTISIYDLLGTICLQTKTEDQSLDISKLEKGIYFLKIIDKQKNVYQQRFMKE